MASKVRRLLRKKGANQAALARSLGVAPARITEWLDPEDTAKPNIYQLRDMARFLDVTMDYLLDDMQERPPEPNSPRMVAIKQIIDMIGEEAALQRLATYAEKGPAKNSANHPENGAGAGVN